jgi:hypothetical protein
MKNLLILLLPLFLSCTKTETPTPQDTLPPITQVGANTAGCIINGKVLIPKNGSQAIGGSPAYGLTTGAGINFHSPIIGDDYKYIQIQNLKDMGGDGIYVHFNDMTKGVGTYIVGQSNGQYFDDGPSNPQIIANTYDGVNIGKTYYSSPNSGIINVTRFDYPNGIYSGTFSCTLYNKDNPNETIQVTDGRFDINVATLNH